MCGGVTQLLIAFMIPHAKRKETLRVRNLELRVVSIKICAGWHWCIFPCQRGSKEISQTWNWVQENGKSFNTKNLLLSAAISQENS